MLNAKGLSQLDADIVEAVFLYQIDAITNKGSGDIRKCYLSIAREDPPSWFMSRFDSLTVPVRPRSEVLRTRDGVFKEQYGILLKVSRIRRISKEVADVYGGHASGPLAGSSGWFRVIRRSGKWVVNRYRVTGIALRAVEAREKWFVSVNGTQIQFTEARGGPDSRWRDQAQIHWYDCAGQSSDTDGTMVARGFRPPKFSCPKARFITCY
jgi:hypothetical protein